MSSRHPHLLPGGPSSWDDEAPQCVVEAMREMRRRAHDDDIVQRLPLPAPLLTPSPVLTPPPDDFVIADETPMAWETDEDDTVDRAGSEPIVPVPDLSPSRSRWTGRAVAVLVIAGAGAAGVAIARTGVTPVGTAGADGSRGTVHAARYEAGPGALELPAGLRFEPAATVEVGEPELDPVPADPAPAVAVAVKTDLPDPEDEDGEEPAVEEPVVEETGERVSEGVDTVARRDTRAAVRRTRRGEAVKQAPGYFTIDATPYASISVDGKPVGDTPLVRVSLRPGRHQVRAVSSAGTEVFTIEVESGSTTRRKLSFGGR